MQNTAMPVWLFRIYALLFLLLPWSVEADFGAWKLTVPAEPLIATAGIGVVVVWLQQRRLPAVSTLGWLSLGWILWQGVAAAFSSMPLVSWKYWLVEAGQWWVFFAGLLLWPAAWPRLLRLFIWSMAGVAVYTIIHHGFYGFRTDQSMLAPMPFFADHTVYSAVLVLVLLALLSHSGRGEEAGNGTASETDSFFSSSAPAPFSPSLLGWLGGTSLFLAGSRAAWISLLVALLAGLAMYFRAIWRWLVPAGILTGCLLLFFKENINTRLASDVSTRERLNRYACALRMVADRPWTGFGPGTFQFQYLPYQKPEEMTRISRKAPLEKRGPENYGRGGGAHSEYLQALGELGWPGLTLWLALLAAGLATTIRRFRQTREQKWLFLSLMLLSYLTLGLVNNFLHDARVAALVWGAFGRAAMHRG